MVRPASPDPSVSAAFSLTVSLIQWIEQQAAKRGVSKALIVREALEAAKQSEQQDEEAA